MRTSQCLCLMIVMVILAAICLPDAPAKAEAATQEAAPMLYESNLKSIVRVHLASMGNPSSLTITVDGAYSAEGNRSISLSKGQTVKVSMNSGTGAITMAVGGQNYAMGQTMTLKRLQTGSESGLRIAQARMPKNLYPGDLQLTSVKSGSVYKLYPIMHVAIETYLEGVLPYEMGGSAPLESLKSQAVAARTYTLVRMQSRASSRFDVVDTTNDQVYNGSAGNARANEAIRATQGVALIKNGKLIETYYTASNGGQTESAANVWGSKGYDYLRVQDDPFDLRNTASPVRSFSIYKDFSARTQNAALKKTLRTNMQKQLGVSELSIVTVHDVRVHTPKYPSPSRLYTKLEVDADVMCSGVLRRVTAIYDIFSELESTLNMSINGAKNELWSVEELDDRFVVRARRFGHGIGMSQRGAMKMGELGYTFDQILTFYFPDCQQVKVKLAQNDVQTGNAEQIMPTVPEQGTAAGIQAVVELTDPDARLAILDHPSASGQVLTGLENGMMVRLFAVHGEWAQVGIGQLTGYTAADALRYSGQVSKDMSLSGSRVAQWCRVAAQGTLNLREGPSKNDRVLATIPENELLPILGAEGTWYQVQYGLVSGYVDGSYLRLHSAYPERTVLGNGINSAVYQNSGEIEMHAEPDSQSTRLLKITSGEAVTVLGCDGDWRKIRYGVMEGWVDMTAFTAPAILPVEPEENVQNNGNVWPDYPAAIVHTEHGSLNLRRKPSAESTVLLRIPQNALVAMLGQNGAWTKVSYQNIEGYVQTKYLLMPGTVIDEPAKVDDDVLAVATVYVNDTLKLRAKPSTGSKVLLQMPKGSQVSILAFTGTWVHVRYQGTEGFVQAKYVRLAGETNDPAQEESGGQTLSSVRKATVATDSDQLNLRAKASKNSKVLTRIPKGTEIDILSLEGDWALTEYNGKRGYVMVRYLIFEGTGRAWIDPGATGVNLRASPDLQSEVLKVLRAGTEIVVTRAADDWVAVTVNGQGGYVAAPYVVWKNPKQSKE